MTDWKHPDLQAAAAEYVIAQVGRKPARGPALNEWQKLVAEQAAALGIDSSVELIAWMDGARIPGVSEAVDPTTVIMEALPPVELRDDETAALMEKLRLIVDYLAGRGGKQAVTVWNVKESTVSMPEGYTVEHRAIPGTSGRRKLAETALIVLTPQGCVWKMMLLARVRRIRQARTGTSWRVDYHQLIPATATMNPQDVTRRLAIIESMFHPERAGEGRRLAQLLGITPAAVHYRRAALREEINGKTGGTAGISGMLNKDQSNKGRAKA